MTQLAHSAGEIVSYLEMCQAWSASFQRGMNFRLRPDCSVILMSRRTNAPYRDRVEDDGRVLFYEGHDVPRNQGCPDPKRVDQPRTTPAGKLTQNGLFEKAAEDVKAGRRSDEFVAVYEKIHAGIWAFNGIFRITDAMVESDGKREVLKFRLELNSGAQLLRLDSSGDVEHNRLIPSAVKLEVWKRDKGCCVQCGANDNLHFDHDLPFSKGGSSLTAKNVKLLCARHNLSKSDHIQ